MAKDIRIPVYHLKKINPTLIIAEYMEETIHPNPSSSQSVDDCNCPVRASSKVLFKSLCDLESILDSYDKETHWFLFDAFSFCIESAKNFEAHLQNHTLICQPVATTTTTTTTISESSEIQQSKRRKNDSTESSNN